MRRLTAVAVFFIAVVSAGPASGANTLTVESKTVSSSATGVQVGIYVENDVALADFRMYFKIRSVTGGAYIANTFAYDEANRFLTAWDGGPLEFTWPGTNPDPCPFVTQGPIDFSSPDAFAYWGFRSDGDGLPIGDDGLPPGGTPSLILTFDVTGAEGTFEIDTTCIMPTRFTSTGGDITPFVFTEGIITVEDATCNDLPCDLNCDGFCDSVDLSLEIDIVFFGLPFVPCCIVE